VLYTHLTRQSRDNAQEFFQAASLIRKGVELTQSIDDFLDFHRSDRFVNLYGKAAIVKSILEAEQHSLLYFAGANMGEPFNPEKVQNT
jgi:hypothetical protein